MINNDELPLVVEDYFASGAAQADSETIGECDPDDLEFWYEAFLEGWDVPDAILAKLELLAELQAERQ